MTDKKIEYGEWEHGFSKLIEECSDGYVFDHDVWRDELYAYIHNNYTPNTELQKAVEEAVRGFAYYLLKRRNKDEFWGLSEGEVEMAMIVAKQYLESEEK
jgi:hypothetical protein